MLNQVVIVGRLIAKPEINKTDEGKQYSNITLAIPRSYKNTKGEYDTDFIDATLCGSISENTSQYCDKGDMIGIKGRLETGGIVVAEKVTFLSSKKKEKENE